MCCYNLAVVQTLVVVPLLWPIFSRGYESSVSFYVGPLHLPHVIACSCCCLLLFLFWLWGSTTCFSSCMIVASPTACAALADVIASSFASVMKLPRQEVPPWLCLLGVRKFVPLVMFSQWLLVLVSPYSLTNLLLSVVFLFL